MSWISNVRNFLSGSGNNSTLATTDGNKNANTNLRREISKLNVVREKQDAKTWRDAIEEAERAFWPFRVKMQTLFLDTVLEGHTKSCIRKRKKLTLLRNFRFADTNGKVNEDLTNRFKKTWFSLFVEYAIEAQLYGYTLISMGDLDETLDNPFPNLSILQRTHVSPDRMHIAKFPYSPAGIDFTKEPYSDWYVYVTTPSETGASFGRQCGYGELYSVGLYSIYLRNLYGQNASFIELFGQPLRVGTTDKLEGPEYDKFVSFMANMGGGNFIVKDGQDTVHFEESKTIGTAYKVYGDFEKRNADLVAKLLLGHADALNSTPGKLGSSQGGEQSPAQIALNETQATDGLFIEHIVNDELLPRLRNLGWTIPEDVKFEFENNDEADETRRTEDKDNLQTATFVKMLKDGGFEIDDEKYLSDRLGVKVVKSAPVAPAVPVAKQIEPARIDAANRVKSAVNRLYKR